MAIRHALRLLMEEFVLSQDEARRVKILYELGEKGHKFSAPLNFLADLVEGLKGPLSLPERRALAGTLPLFLRKFPENALFSIERFAARTSSLDVFNRLKDGLKDHKCHPSFRWTPQFERTARALQDKHEYCRGIVFETWNTVGWEICDLVQRPPPPPEDVSRNGTHKKSRGRKPKDKKPKPEEESGSKS